MKKQVVFLLATFLVAHCGNALSIGDLHLLRHREPPPPPISADNTSGRAVYEGYVTQLLDHFNPNEIRTFQMRFYANDNFYQPGGPLFIYVGGEWSISTGWVTGGHMVDMARDLNGYIFYTEHRFYGESRPTADLSVENLRYLDIDQAIEDLAEFIRVQRATLPGARDSGVILVGASYSATLVSWFRQRYPDLVNGAWSSSAPLHAQVDFGEYKYVVGQSVALVGGQQCYDRIERAFNQIEKELNSRQFFWLDQDFNTCTSLADATDIDIWNFYDSISNMMSSVVQGHYIRSTSIQNACNVITTPDIVDDVTAYANFVGTFMNGWCLDNDFWNVVDYFKETSWNAPAARDQWRQWFWQTCNEYGWYQTLSHPNQPFGNRTPVHLSTRLCDESYSHHFSPATIEANVQRTNSKNHGFNANFTNVFSTHGQLDPWSSMGILTAPNAASPVTVIPMASHCNDLYSLSDADSPDMRAAKLKIRQLVEEWL